MGREPLLIDAGPIVALLAANDAAHRQCVDETRKLTPPFVTTWAVLAEAAWLLRHTRESIPRLMAFLQAGLIECRGLDGAAAPAIARLATTYADLRPDLADLTLVYLAQRDGIQTVFTLDRRDFSVYRDASGNAFELVPNAM
jgi:predicted nucleic acid-binding protein